MDLPNLLTNDLDSDNISCECHSNNDRPGESSLGDSICRQSISSVRETIKKYEPNDNNYNSQDIKRGSYGSLRSLKSARSISNNLQLSNQQQPQQQQQQQQSQSQNNNNNNNFGVIPRSSREVINQHIVYDDHNNGTLIYQDNNSSYKQQRYNNNNNNNNNKNNDELTSSNQGYQSNCQLFKKNDLDYIRGKDIDTKLINLNHLNNNNNTNINMNTEQKINLNNSDISYQSKTTIAKTANGVRIITDIFFDTNTEYNWQGSRIETDIPPSKILKDFQEKNHLK